MESLPVFPNYLQLRERSRVSPKVWQVTRTGSVVVALALVVTLWVEPALGLKLFWGVLVPVLPVLFLVAPGLWRNICPLAAANQTPRLFKFTRALTLPAWMQEYSYVIGISLFFVLASSRKWLFNQSGPATALLIMGLIAAAFLGGIFFKGKSGWCSSICPLLPVQRMYNQTPFILIGNAHCAPCVGCTKNCYDFNPGVANLADMYDNDRYYTGYRQFFIGAFPGFILAFFLTPNPPEISIFALYLAFFSYMAVSLGSFLTLRTFVKVTDTKLITLYGAAALNLFYWFVIPAWLNNVFGSAPLMVIWPVRVFLLGITLAWIVQTYRKEPKFVAQLMPHQETKVSGAAARALKQAISQEGRHEVTYLPDELRLMVEEGRTLLETAEQNDLRIEPGCRMGVCGADPIVIVQGMDNLSHQRDDEHSTLDRLGLANGNVRLACMARVNGPVSFSLDLSLVKQVNAELTTQQFDENIRQVVIVGNGIAGVTAADHIRRRHPACEIHLIGKESHHLYNRMAITRLIYGRSAMNGLYLQPDQWYEEKKITPWLNTMVSKVDRSTRQVKLATGETLPYDRLILATGSRSFVPTLPGFGLPGTYVLREAEDAMQIRAFVQKHQTQHAVVAGGGLLGLEAAYALYKLGLKVTVLERGPWLLRRQLDERGADFLHQYLLGLGLDIVFEAECAAANGTDRLEQITLKDGRTLNSDLLLICVGISPNIELAQTLGLTTKRGIVVDDGMHTDDPDIFAVGDACEHQGQVPGLWPVAVEQAKIAAINAVGGNECYTGTIPVTHLKVVGVELTSIGQIEANSPEDVTIVQEDVELHHYRKLVIVKGKAVGAILLGYPLDASVVTTIIKDGVDIAPYLETLQAGQWDQLHHLGISSQ